MPARRLLSRISKSQPSADTNISRQAQRQTETGTTTSGQTEAHTKTGEHRETKTVTQVTRPSAGRAAAASPDFVMCI